MDIKEFAKEFIDNVRMSVEMTGSDYDQELATSILEYMENATNSFLRRERKKRVGGRRKARSIRVRTG